MADGDRFRLDGEPGRRTASPFRQDVVEQHGIDAAEQQIAVRMDIVVVRHRLDAVLALGAEQDLVGDGAAERADVAAAQIGERAKTRRDRRRGRSAPRGTRSRESSTASAARRAGVSSMPLRPMSASPRSIDWSIDVNVIITNRGVRPGRAP